MPGEISPRGDRGRSEPNRPEGRPPSRGPQVPPVDPPLPPTQLPLSGGSPNRDECWEKLRKEVREKLLRASGSSIAWFARETSDDERRIRAVIFGLRGLAIAEPEYRYTDGEYRPVYQILTYNFSATGVQREDVNHRPPAGLGSGRGSPVENAGPPDHAYRYRGYQAAEVLAGLPARAYSLLHEPHAQHDGEIRYEAYWEGSTPSVRNPFMVVLASPRWATVAVGRRIIPVGHDSTTAHWHLSCGRAEIVRRQR